MSRLAQLSKVLADKFDVLSPEKKNAVGLFAVKYALIKSDLESSELMESFKRLEKGKALSSTEKETIEAIAHKWDDEYLAAHERQEKETSSEWRHLFFRARAAHAFMFLASSPDPDSIDEAVYEAAAAVDGRLDFFTAIEAVLEA